MFDLCLSDEQLAMQRTLRDFVNREIKPVATKRDLMADFPERFPWDIVNKASRFGLRTSALSVENGGSAADALTCCIIGEELAVGDLGVAVTLGQTSALAHNYFDIAMNGEQRRRYLPGFLADETYHLAIGQHEPDTDFGYDYFVDEIPGAGDKTRAVRGSGGNWIIDGAKNFQTNGTIAKLIAVRARTEWGPASFLVPGTAPGLTRHQIDGSGRRLAGWAELYFDHCVVPDEDRLGELGKPPQTGLGPASLPRLAATTLGVGRAAFEAALAYAKLRVQGGKPIVEHQAVGSALAEMAINIEAARALAWQAAWAHDRPDALTRAGLSDKPLGRMAMVFASQVAFDAACRASTLFGGAGLLRELPMQKYIRDASVYLHAAPRDVGLLRVAEVLAEYCRPAALFSNA